MISISTTAVDAVRGGVRPATMLEAVPVIPRELATHLAEVA
jgi:hypothetical protein